MSSGVNQNAALSAALQPGSRVFVAGLTGESALLLDELSAAPERAAGVEFTSVQLPGVDRADFLALHPQSRLQGFFMTPAIRSGLVDGRATLQPLDYNGIARFLREADPFDTVIAQFTPPDADGWCSPGLTADFTPIVWKQARRKVAHLNPRLPRVRSSFRIHVSEFDQIVEAEAPLLAVPEAKIDPVSQRIGEHAATLIQDGDTLQFGLGSVISAVAASLHGHRKLRIHSGMIAGFAGGMWQSGCLDPGADIVTGVIFGEPEFYETLVPDMPIRLEDVRHTHSTAVLTGMRRLVGVNSAVEVDLFGQVNSERSDGRLQAGAGGLPAFAIGAQAATDSRLLICLPSTARRGTVSRIVPAIDGRGLCTVPRYLADAVITEYGVAQLRGRSLTERAQALIAVAHPDHRETLTAAWGEYLRQI